MGNPSRGDDALGPLLLERVVQRFPGVATLGDFQLQIEHALDLRGHDLVLFIDAATGLDVPYTLTEIQPDARQPVPLTHALTPQAVLDVYVRIEGCAPPPAFVLAVAGQDFELGAALSEAGRRALDAAWDEVVALLSAPVVGAWRGRAAGRSGG
ncbi:MAG: hydrogenase maturation protease [Rhodocyclales bacterium]|nr:hydrogenase maturation protease [Rhodocyclales bacterium]